MIKKKMDKISSVCGLLIVWGIVAVVLLAMFHIGEFHIEYPLSNTGRDDTSYMAEIKMSYDTGSWKSSEYLGAPFGTDRSSNISYYLFNDVHLLSMALVYLTGSVFMAQNLTYILLFYINSAVTYAVLSVRKINPGISIVGTISFTFLTYVFYRNVSHMMLTPIYTIPLAILICLWIFEDDRVARYGKGFFHYKRNWAVILFSILIVNSGIGYYTVFACFFFMVAGIYKTVERRSFLGIQQFLSQVVTTFICMGVTISGYVIDVLQGKNSVMTSLRSYGDAEIYALKIVRLFLPMKGTGIQRIDNVLAAYNASAVCQTETSEYLGVLGVIGCIILFLALFANVKKSEIKMMSVMTICAILYGAIGGLGVVFFLFVTDMVRCTNRISVYIAFMSIYTVCLLLQRLYNWIKQHGTMLSKILFQFVMCLVLVVTLWNQVQWHHFDNNAQIQACDMQQSFVEELEETVPDGAMIYQLPYWEYPPGPGINNMNPNELLQPYLYSTKVKWSFGAFSGERSLKWNAYVSQLNVNDMVDSLSYMGFEGIFINSGAYTEDECTELTSQLNQIFGKPDIVSADDKWYYYDISQYAQQLKKNMSEEEWQNHMNQVKGYGEQASDE